MNINPQTLLKGRYEVVPRTLILIFTQDSVLLQKGSESKKIWAGYYNGLGGHIERGEDVLSAARRELREEAGLECDDLRLFGTIMIDVEENNGIVLFVLSGRQIRGDIKASEEGSLHWIKIEDVQTLKVVEDIPELIERIRKTQDETSIFHAHYGYSPEGKRVNTLG